MSFTTDRTRSPPTRRATCTWRRAGAHFTYGTLHADTTSDFLARLDPATGDLVWGQVLSDYQNVREFEIADLKLDAAGNCYLAARSNGGISNSGPYSLLNLAMAGAEPGKVRYAVVAKCDPTGQLAWARQIFVSAQNFGTLYQSQIDLSGMGVNATGCLTICAAQRGRLYFSSPTGVDSTYSPPDTAWAFGGLVARYTPAGAVQWVTGTDSRGSCLSVGVDAAGNTYGSTLLIGRTSFGGISVDTTGVYLTKIDPQGRPRWVKLLAPAYRISAPDVAMDANDRPYLTGVFYDSVTFGSFTLVKPPANAPGSWTGYLVACDTAGNTRWARTYNPARSVGTSRPVGAGVDAAGHVYLYAHTYADDVSLDYDGQVVKGRGAYLIRYDEAAQIGGRVYRDDNANSRRDPGEPAFPRPVLVSETGRPYAASSTPSTGSFMVFADTGQYHVAIPRVPRYHTLTQGAPGYSGHLRTYGQTDTARVFGLAPIPNQTDVRVTLTPFSVARRGFANRYRARVENLGTVAASGDLTVQFDGLLLYAGAPTPPASHTTTAATWSFANLPPFGIRDFDVAATVPLNVPLDTTLHSRATVTVAGDLDPANNVDAVAQRIVGSWDPNDLRVNYATLTPAQVAGGTLLDYVVRFQNMGTDTAFTVVITDTLPAHLLQLGTLEPLSASHDCTMDVLGNNQLVVRFDNVNLPPTGTSALHSMGFVRFQVKPSAALMPGQLIPNTAHIVFDYNAPVATNGVTTLVQTPNGLVAAPGASSLSLHPNPATRADYVTLTAHVPAPGPLTVQLTDALGRPVRQLTVATPAGPLTQRLDVRGLAPGFYVARLAFPDGSAASRKLVVAAQ